MMSMEKDGYDDIGKLLREGWSIRVKTVKGRDYLSARKDKDEKGLGPLTDEVRKYLEDLYHPSDKSENTGAADLEPMRARNANNATSRGRLQRISLQGE
jgi:ribosomal protein L34